MQQPEVISPGGRSQNTIGWLQAYFLYLKSSRENRVLKMMPLVLLGIVPISILDDFLIPILGVVDDLPTALVTVVVLALTLKRVSLYRNVNKLA